MAMPRPKQPIYAAGYYRPRRSRPVHFLPPMKVKLEDSTTTKKTDADHLQSAAPRGRHTEHNKGRRGRYKKMIMTLACNLTVENVSDMKFLCREHVRPPQLLDNIRYPRDLIDLLEHQRLLAENSLYFMQTMLYYISRLDLYELVLDFRADRQQEYKDRGVDIKAVYDIRNESSDRVVLAQELSQFRQDLKPKSRFQRADVNGLRSRLNDLTTKMNHRVSDLQQTAEMKNRMLHDDGEKLPAILAGVAEQVDGDSESEEKKEVVVKLKLYNRKEESISRASQQKVRKRTKIPSVASSMVSTVTESPTESIPIHVVIPNASYEPDDDPLRLTPHMEEHMEPAPEEVFNYASPIPPPRSEALNPAGKVVNKKIKVIISDYEKGDISTLSPRTPSTAGNTCTTASREHCGHPTRADLDTQHLSDAIQKLRKKMGLNAKDKVVQSKNTYHEYQRTVPQKSKRHKKERKHSDASRKGKLKNRKLSGKSAKLPNIYDKYARDKSQSKMQYMNILK